MSRSCDSGYSYVCATAAQIYRAGAIVHEDRTKSAHLDDQACQLGEMTSCTYLAYAYQSGLGVRRDAQQAQRLYEQACKGGDDNGCYNIAKPHLAQLRTAWCALNDWKACADLARQYEHSEGVTEDLSRAWMLYDRACVSGQAAACRGEAALYRGGLGVARDESRADELERAACTHDPRCARPAK